MRNLTITQLRMQSFQKFKNYTVDFSDAETHIIGENRSGKTTIHSAMTWLLFGKDSSGRTDTGRGAFDIRRREGGQPCLDSNVVVAGTFLLDGTRVKLQRELRANWQKDVYKGDETYCFINDVPTKVGEYQSYISDIITEDEFRMISTLGFFTSLKTDYQRNYLCTMGGVQSLHDICNTRSDWKDFLDVIAGRDLAGTLAELSFQRKKLEKEHEKIEPSIQALQKMKPEEKDWIEIDCRRKLYADRMEAIDSQLTDFNRLEDGKQREINALRKQKNELDDKFYAVTQRIQKLKSQAVEDARKAIEEKNRDKFDKKAQLEEAKRKRDSLRKSIVDYTLKAENAQKEMNAYAEEYKEVQSRTFAFDEDNVICPLLKGHVCSSPAIVQYIEQNRDKAEADFNAKKAEKLAAIIKSGKLARETREEAREYAKSCSAQLDSISLSIEALNTVLNSMPEYKFDEASVQVPEKTSLENERIAINGQKNRLQEQIDALQSKPASDTEVAAALKSEKQKLQAKMKQAIEELVERTQIDKMRAEIKSYAEEGRRLAAQITDIENKEAMAREIGKAIVEDATERINKLFTFVQWQLFEQQKNGGYSEVCKPCINGVSSSLNTESVINANIDICNAIARYKEFTAPLFIDNAESVNETLPYIGQSIKMTVAPKGTKLSITKL